MAAAPSPPAVRRVDARARHLGALRRAALAANDEFRAPEEVRAEVSGWSNTTVDVIGGASHFFVGRTDALTQIVSSFVDESVGATDSGTS